MYTFIVFRKEDANICLETSKTRAARETKTDSKKAVKKEEFSKDHKDKAHIEGKFENYFKFSMPVKSIKPHQVSTVYSIHCNLMINYFLL
jgi:penicillin-binding protein-related factor A (putative recombinase)